MKTMLLHHGTQHRTRLAFALCTAVLCLLTALPVTAAAYKVIEKSDKKAPEWLYKQPEGTILVEIEAPTLGKAQADAETEIARRIIASVATNIRQSSQYTATQTSDGDDVRSQENFTSSVETAAASLPFLTGISISKALGTYWEKREDKTTKQRTVTLSVLYPLTHEELASMTAEFEAADSEKSQELASLKADIDKVTTSDEINAAVAQLKTLQEYFFDSVRKAEARNLGKRYSDLYKELTLSGTFGGGNRLTCRITLDGRPFRLTARPELTANCASALTATFAADGYSFDVTYSTDDCLSTEENWIEVSFRLRTGSLRQRFVIPASAD